MDINYLKPTSSDNASFLNFILGSIEMSNMIITHLTKMQQRMLLLVVFGVVILDFGKH